MANQIPEEGAVPPLTPPLCNYAIWSYKEQQFCILFVHFAIKLFIQLSFITLNKQCNYSAPAEAQVTPQRWPGKEVKGCDGAAVCCLNRGQTWFQVPVSNP